MQELDAALVNAGVPREAITRARSRQDAQLLGEVLVIAAGLALPYFDAFLKGAAHKAGERALDAILRKWGTSARIERDGAPATVVGERYRRTAKARTPEQARTLAELKSLGVVLLGANSFPHYPQEWHLDNDTFGRSAQLVRKLLCSSRTVFQDVKVLDLFDQEKRPEEIVDGIEEFLNVHKYVRDVIIYYCGHGAFMDNRERTYYVLLRGTRPDRAPITGLDPKAFKTMIDANAVLSSRRCTLMLDCCFAGQAVDAFQLASLDPIIELQLADLPSRGFALLAASGRKLTAIARHGSDATMFAGALAEVLNCDGPPEALSLGDLCQAMTKNIKSKYGQNGVLPQCHAVDQSDGDLTRIPMFVRGTASADEKQTGYRSLSGHLDSYGHSGANVNTPGGASECEVGEDQEDCLDGFVGYSEFSASDSNLFVIADEWIRNMTAVDWFRTFSEDEDDAFRAIDGFAKAAGVSADLDRLSVIAWCAMIAHAEVIKDTDYIVKNGQIVLIDEAGRPLAGERFRLGVQQAVQAKERVEIN